MHLQAGGEGPSDDSHDDASESTGPWTPAAGTFDAWPESLSELKTLDPCCGSGHFLVAALLMLTPMRMELEGLSATEAVDRVLSENLHGLEIDQRCVELAAFALALAAWRFPSGDKPGGYRVLPDLNVACCGLSVSVAKEEWKKLARGNKQLKIALDWMYDEFKDAPVLGSLLNPAKSMAARVVDWEELSPMLLEALSAEQSEEAKAAVVVAHGLSRAALLLGDQYQWVVTNVPFLGFKRQGEALRNFCESKYEDSQTGLATTFSERAIQFLSAGGVSSVVVNQTWLFQPTSRKLREKMLDRTTWAFVGRLGARAFETISGDVVNVALVIQSKDSPKSESKFGYLDVQQVRTVEDKSSLLSSQNPSMLIQEEVRANPASVVTDVPLSKTSLLSEVAISASGLKTGDRDRFNRNIWEVELPATAWEYYQVSSKDEGAYSGRDEVIFWEKGKGQLAQLAEEVRHLNHVAQNWRRGQVSWNRRGISVSAVGKIESHLFDGHRFDSGVTVVTPNDSSQLSAIWSYCASPEFEESLRAVDSKISITTSTVLKVVFDLAHWQQVASEKYPHGLPEPYSNDPTQWIFHGHPASSTDALQVAVARLLGYRWPAELDGEMELSTDARAWIERSSQLYDSSQNDTADDDGIVCIPPVGTEQPAEDRLLNLLHRAYEEGRAQEQVFCDKLDAADENDPVTVDLWRRGWQPSLPDSFPAWRDSLLEAVGHTGKTLESWLRDKFFTQHMKLFHHRPFIWHIWDGLKDGFSVLVNYHKLDNKLLNKLIHTHLNDWINKQKNSSEDGHEERLAAAESLKLKLEKILKGESPHDIFVRWKPLSEQPIGWTPDLDDGVRLNIRPWMTVGDVKKKGAGVLRDKPNCKWTKDRGKDVESAPWYHLGPEYGEKVAARINDHHLTLEEKKNSRGEA